ncbi:MAG: hypothetical protein A2Z77_00420 [Chloroflexi bacterium RBG_13_51_36]|nr:MAG: hypothetical protein A2Z77_00420 [Chloroflexi bacterium RBG_13_51_36]
MVSKKYAKNIVSESIAPPMNKESMNEYKKMMEDQKKAGNSVEVNMLYTIQDSIVKGSFHMGASWVMNLKGTKPVQMELANTHDCDEVLGFAGSDPDNPRELGAEVELWLEDEKYIINKSCFVFIPKGMKHCPMLIRKVDKPFFGFGAMPVSNYGRPWEGKYKEASYEGKKGSPALKYAKYIVTEKPAMPQLSPDAKRMFEDQKKAGNSIEFIQFAKIQDSIVKGSFGMGASWLMNLKGTRSVQVEMAHTHDCDEILGFAGSDPYNPRELNGEIELWLEDEKHTINKSCLVFIPRGMKHCPMLIKKIDKPILNFGATIDSNYERPWEEKYNQ